MVETSERAMVRKYEDVKEAEPAERFTSLQPTYEDTMAPDPDDDWLDE